MGIHATISVAWLLVFLAQVTLVATGRTALHRRLGIIGAGLIVAFTATGIATKRQLAHVLGVILNLRLFGP